LNRRSSGIRALFAWAAVASAIALAGCETDGTTKSSRHLKPLSPQMLSLIEEKGMSKNSPILVRIFKQESELEIWKQDRAGRFALLKTYPMCRWSGELGPKIREGDRQAPEGFYTVTPGQMNPNSSYYLSFNLGYPNAFDRAHGRTGAHLMVHGDCTSAGCYSVSDEQIAEIYALGRESFFGGQRSFQVQAYPFRMTPTNMAKHRNNPNMPFWKNLKEGYDHFEVTRQEPKVDVCEKRYVFNARASAPFSPAGACPPYEVPQEIAEAVARKKNRDEAQTAELISQGIAAAPIRTNTDGGMHPSFRSKYATRVIRDERGMPRMVVEARAPGSFTPGEAVLPDDTSAPAATPAPEATPEPAVMTASVPLPRPSPLAKGTAYATASADSPGGSEGNLFSRLFSSGDNTPSRAEPSGSENALDRVGRMFGFGGDDKPAPRATTPTPRPQRRATAAAEPAARPEPRPAARASEPAAQPSPQPQPAATAQAAPPPPATISGAQPVLPTGTFDSRWSAFR